MKMWPRSKSAAELDLIDGQERHLEIGWHGLDGCHPIAGVGGDDLLLAGDEGNGMVARSQSHPVIDFTRQQPERQADHAAAVGQHAFYGEMGLSGIGGTQDCSDGQHAGRNRAGGISHSM